MDVEEGKVGGGEEGLHLTLSPLRAEWPWAEVTRALVPGREALPCAR